MKTENVMASPNRDEIDLIEIIRILWSKKWWIVTTTAIFTLIAGTYAFTAKEKWTSQAEIISPRVYDLGSYFDIRQDYAFIAGHDFDPAGVLSSLSSKFNRLIYSLDSREQFFENSSIFKELLEKDELNEDAKRKVLNGLVVKDIEATKPDAKKDPDAIGYKLSFSAEDPETAQKTLRNFINFISDEAIALDIKEFNVFFNKFKARLTAEKATMIHDLAVQKNVQIDNLQKALLIAQKANIKEYTAFGAPSSRMGESYGSSQGEDSHSTDGSTGAVPNEAKISLSDSKIADSTYLFILGERYLQAQIDVIKANAIVYPPRFYQIENKLRLLKELETKLNNISNIQAYSYQSSPSYPVDRDWPKRLLLLLVGAFLGGIIGSAIVLVSNWVKKDSD